MSKVVVRVRQGYDSAFGYNDIPISAEVVCGYASKDPTFGWPLSAWQRFPNSTRASIATRATITGPGIAVLDVENGDATPQQGPGWAGTQRAFGQVPTIYCNESSWAEVVTAFNAAGVEQPCYWIAEWDNDDTALPTMGSIKAIGKQYADSQMTGQDYDRSIFADYWPGVDPVPQPEDVMGNVRSGITVDNVNGHAYAVLTEGSNSEFFSGGWFSLTSLYGTSHADVPVNINFLNDSGTVIAQVAASVSWNKRSYWPLPDGVGIVTADWSPLTDGTVLAGCIELASR